MNRFFVIRPRGDELRRIFEAKIDKKEQSSKYTLIETEWGEELGLVLGEIKCHKVKAQGKIIKFFKENDRDLESYLLNAENKEKKAFINFRDLVKKHKLDKAGMKPIKAYLTFDQKKMIFYYTAPKRIDFRNLLKDLISTFPNVIRLQQINQRQESLILGGCGICGREFCCHQFLRELLKISRDSLEENLGGISSIDKMRGPCGYLRCCLTYERDDFKKLKKLPKKEKSSKIDVDKK